MITQCSDSAVGDQPAVDESVLGALVAELDPDDTGMRGALLGGFLDDSAAQIDRLLTAARSGDVATVASAAHTLRSTSALLGAMPLAALLRVAEDAAGSDPSLLPGIAAEVAAEHERVSVTVRRLLVAVPAGNAS